MQEDSEDIDEQYSKWIADNRTPNVPLGYWKTAEDMEECINIIRESKQDDVKRDPANNLNRHLKRCLLNVNLCKLKAIYKNKEDNNPIGYNPSAVADFVTQMLRAYPKPELSEIEVVEDEVSIRQIFMQAGAIETELKDRICGQDAAIERLSEAFFNMELKARLTPNRRGPRNAYLLAGPPGVGKTLMAQQFAFRLGFPFKRFDMSEYSHHEIKEELIGYSLNWRNPQPGMLTEFVSENPKWQVSLLVGTYVVSAY